MTQKNETTIRFPMEPSHDAALLQLPDQLMLAARKENLSPGQARSFALRAVTIALLSAIPLRLKNVVELRLGQHLQRADPKRRHISTIIIDGSENKRRSPSRLA